METIIEEGIWDIKQKSTLRRAVFKCDGKTITRNLFVLDDFEENNSKIDVINLEKIKIEINPIELNKLSDSELGVFIKEKLKPLQPITCFNRNVNNEIRLFTNPIITKK